MKILLTAFVALLFSDSIYAQSIAAGGAHTLVICNSGTLESFGMNQDGQLGNGNWNLNGVNTPQQVQLLTDVIKVAAYQYHSVALKSDGTVWAWGSNTAGQLGDSSTTSSVLPVQVTGLANVIDVAAGFGFSAALKSDGTVWAWGANSLGQLGNGSNTPSLVPVQVSGLQNIIDISTAHAHTMALRNDSTVWSWGYNLTGTNGDGTTNTGTIPVQTLIDSVITIDAGANHNLAIRFDGSVWAWGDNGLGALGNGSTQNSLYPVLVQNLTDVRVIAAGLSFSIAMKNDGSIWAWGDNSSGQFGNGAFGSAGSSLVPVASASVAGAVFIDCGEAHTVILQNSGNVITFGGNVWGQLGNGNFNFSTQPVQPVSLCPALTSVNENVQSAPSVYPVPFNNQLILEGVAGFAQGAIYDMNGRFVIGFDIDSERTVINTAPIQPGIYMLRLDNGAAIKLIRE